MRDAKATLSTLWVFVLFNYLYCDVLGMMDKAMLRGYLEGEVGGIHVTGGFLLAAAILMEIPIAMVLLSRLLPYRANRWANIAAGAFMTMVQFSTLFFGTSPTGYYIFASVVEIGATAAIVWYAWNWQQAVSAPPAPDTDAAMQGTGVS